KHDRDPARDRDVLRRHDDDSYATTPYWTSRRLSDV
ncbi:MAG: hypothetical protein QOC87_1648, partial [Actinomycetota bacterium]|nr:hypothetical protein [Actinomycetota bacterium]